MNQLIQNDRTSGTIFQVLIFRPQGWVKLQIRVLYCVSSYLSIKLYSVTNGEQVGIDVKDN
jgi:hypothetical protein